MCFSKFKEDFVMFPIQKKSDPKCQFVIGCILLDKITSM